MKTKPTEKAAPVCFGCTWYNASRINIREYYAALLDEMYAQIKSEGWHLAKKKYSILSWQYTSLIIINRMFDLRYESLAHVSTHYHPNLKKNTGWNEIVISILKASNYLLMEGKESLSTTEISI